MPEGAANPSDRGADVWLVGTRFGPVRWFETIDSTNRYALGEAARGAPEGLVAVADSQTAGRGRLGRTWEAPPNASLLVSVLLRPPVDLAHRHLVTVASALAASDAVAALAGIDATLKWPNDLHVGGRKLAGILAEATGDAVVVGMGLNVSWDEVPEHLEGIATACNLVGSRPVDRSDLLVAWLRALDPMLDKIASAEGRDGLLEGARQRSATLGTQVKVELAGSTLVGIATDLTEEGYLVVRNDDGDHVISAGDVVHLRPA